MKISRNNLRNAAGFTLVEILLYISLSVIIVGVVSGAVFMYLEIQTRNEVIQEVERQGEFAMRTIKLAVQSAGSFNTASGTTLSLATPDANVNPTVFSLASGALTETEGTGATVALTNDKVTVSGLSFINVTRANTNGMVRVQFTISHNTSSSRYQYDYSKIYYSTAQIR